MGNFRRIPEVAKMLGISDSRAYELARLGLLPVVHLGRQLRVCEDQLQEFIEKGGKALPGGWKKEV